MPKGDKNCSLMALQGKCLQTGDREIALPLFQLQIMLPPHLLLRDVGCHGEQHDGKGEKHCNVKSIQAIYTFGSVFSLELNLNCFTIFYMMLKNSRP